MFKEPASPSPRYVTAVELMSRRYDIWGLPVFGPADDSLSWVAGKKTRAEHSSWWSEETRQVPSLKGCRTMIIESPLQLIFRDLFYRLPAFAGRHDVFLKLEGFNITGSIKIKTALGLVEDLEQRGMARPNETVLVESSSVHAEQTANEIAREFDKVDWVFVGTGTAGTLAGISERLRAGFPRIKVVAVEPVGSVTFGGRPGKRNIPGIGASVRPKLADLAKPDRIVAVKEESTVEACLSFVRNYHLLVGGSTGTVLAAVQQLAPEFSRGDTIVAISADLGEKYMDTIYDPAWVEKVIVPEDDRPARTYASVSSE